MPRVVVITGASSGIGRATARRFAAPDLRLALIARDREGLEAAAHLARTAVNSQLSDVDSPNGRPDNLFEPAPGDPGAHGPYDERAHEHSVQLWATKHCRGLLAATVLGAAVGIGAAATR